MVPLSTLKQALRIDFTADDRELQRLVDAAVAYIENYLGYGLCRQSATIYLKDWDQKLLRDDGACVVTYTDGSGATITMVEGTDYWIDRSDGFIIRFLNKPSFKEGTQPQIVQTTGYVAMPKDLQQALIGLVGHWYANVEATSQFDFRDVPHSTKAILDLRRWDGGGR